MFVLISSRKAFKTVGSLLMPATISSVGGTVREVEDVDVVFVAEMT